MKTNNLKTANSATNPIASPQSNKVTVSVPGNGKMKEIEIDFDALNKIEPTKAGCTYPDLESQVRYSILGIERTKNKIVLDTMEMLPVFYESGVIDILLDAINNYMASELETASAVPDDPGVWFQDVQFKVRTLVETTKKIIHLEGSLRCFDGQMDHIEYAKRGVLV